MSTPSASNKRPSSVRHTRAIQQDRRLHPSTEAPDELIQARLEELIHPATYAQLASYRALGLRERVLNLPVMVAFVLSLIWRHLGSVHKAVRVLHLEGFLWATPQPVSKPPVSEHLRTFPAVLFERFLQEVRGARAVAEAALTFARHVYFVPPCWSLEQWKWSLLREDSPMRSWDLGICSQAGQDYGNRYPGRSHTPAPAGSFSD